MVEELTPSDEHKEFKKGILKTFVETPITKQTEAQQIYSLVSRLVYDPAAPSDPYQGAAATKACKTGASVDFKHLHNEHYAKKMASEIKKNTKILMNCGATDTKANFKNLEKRTLAFEITTPFPLVSLPVIDEEYQNYDADDTSAEKAKKYEEASINYVDICQTTLKMIALTVVEGEDTVVSGGENVSVQVTKLTGEELVAAPITIKGASFWASSDLTKVMDGIEVMVCCWERDPFWWNPSGVVVYTNVVLVQLRRNQEELTKFDKSFRVLLDFKHQQDVAIRDFEGGKMSVVKVDVKKGESFFVRFHSKCDGCTILITDFDKPEETVVRSKGLTVNDDDQFYEEHNHDYDGWHYVSVLSKVIFDNRFKTNLNMYF